MSWKRRTPKGYDGTRRTNYHIDEVFSSLLGNIKDKFKDRPDLILAAWPVMMGPQMAKMTQAVSFANGVLLVKVKNSTLHSLLAQQEKSHILAKLRQQFPSSEIKTIVFRIG